MVSFVCIVGFVIRYVHVCAVVTFRDPRGNGIIDVPRNRSVWNGFDADLNA
jgi:hypothetical protein